MKPTRYRAERACRATAGFSLVELLVVVSIVAVLAALAFPALGRAIQAAHRNASAGNLRELGAGMLLFAGDNGGALPVAAYKYQPTGGTKQFTTWDIELAPYLSATGPSGIIPILRDPGDTLPRLGAPANYARTRSYAMVSNYGQGTGLYSYAATPPVPVPLAAVTSPAKTLLLVTYPANTNCEWSDSCAAVQYTSQLASGNTMYGGKLNFLYCDGHVDFLAPADTIGKGTMANPKGGWTLTPED